MHVDALYWASDDDKNCEMITSARRQIHTVMHRLLVNRATKHRCWETWLGMREMGGESSCNSSSRTRREGKAMLVPSVPLGHDQ